MRIAVISDLHIGAEDFRPDGFADFLDHLEREHDEIILLGDVLECYFPALPWKALADTIGSIGNTAPSRTASGPAGTRS